jgi:putative FmdB family regulatory protein
MPLYEYYCESCNGVFELLRQMREASEPAPCPLCDRDSQRIMPTSFSAFTFRDGMPRTIPDRGTYWWYNKQTKEPNRGGVPAHEHHETYKPPPPTIRSKGELEVERDINFYKQRHAARMKDSDFANTPIVGADGKPLLSPKFGMG